MDFFFAVRLNFFILLNLRSTNETQNFKIIYTVAKIALEMLFPTGK